MWGRETPISKAFEEENGSGAHGMELAADPAMDRALNNRDPHSQGATARSNTWYTYTYDAP